jgi:hypothetical protein
MNLGKLKYWVDVGVGRSDLSNEYANVINQAIRHICDCRTWTWMQTSATITFEPESQQTTLPNNFKELIGLEYPLVLNNEVYTDISFKPRKEFLRLKGAFRNAGQGRTLLCNLQWVNNVPTIVLPFKTDVGFSLELSYHGYPSILTDDLETNNVATQFPEMVINKAKAFLFEIINDIEAAASSNDVFVLYYNKAAAMDARKKIAGITLRI